MSRLSPYEVRYRFWLHETHLDERLFVTRSDCCNAAARENGGTDEPSYGYTVEVVIIHAPTDVVLLTAATDKIASSVCEAMNKHGDLT